MQKHRITYSENLKVIVPIPLRKEKAIWWWWNRANSELWLLKLEGATWWMSPRLGQSSDLLGVSEYKPHPCWGITISLPTSHLPLLLHRIVFCLLWRNEWSEILNWKKCSRHTFDSLGPHGSYLLRADNEPDYAFVMSLVLPMTPRDGEWKFISQRRRLKMLRGCSRSHTYEVTALNHWAPHWSPFSSARDAELLGWGCGPRSSSILSFPADSNGLPGLGTTTLHHLSCKSGIFYSILQHRFLCGVGSHGSPLQKTVYVQKVACNSRSLQKFWSFYMDSPKVMNSDEGQVCKSLGSSYLATHAS